MRCDFCDEFDGGHRNAFASRYGHNLRRGLFETEQFRVVPSLGQIVEGHVLVVPVSHVCALADLSSSELRALEVMRPRVRSVMGTAYSNCIFFEHGVRGEGAGGCGIDHAHMHAVPVAADGVLEKLQQEFGGNRVDSIQGIKYALPAGSSYLFFEDVNGDRFVFPVSNLPSQFLRKLVAESIGKSNWDWRACGYEPELISTIQRLSPLFSPLAASQRG
jgi:diadenosine tetraphosphate (Ap4A) HIT family hydrolase